MMLSAKGHPEMVFVLTGGHHGKVRYYRHVMEVVKAIANGHGVVDYDPDRGGFLKHFEFGCLTVMFLDRPGRDLTHLALPVAHELWDYTQAAGGRHSNYTFFMGKSVRDPAKEKAREAFFKQKRAELKTAIERELGI